MSNDNKIETKKKQVCIVMAGSVDSGKCFGHSTLIMRFDKSFIEVQNIKIGDKLMGDDFLPRTVLETHKGYGQLFKIKTEDNKTYIVNGEHILCLYYCKNSKNIKEIAVNDYLNLNKDEHNFYKWFRVGDNNTETRIRIKKYKYGNYYGFEVDQNKRFLLYDYSVCHNSTTIGVLCSGNLDNGNGSAREIVAVHPHEISSGKTSDIATKTIKLDENNELIMVDLCGHEKYLKTTLFGITGYFPDYGILVVAANRGLLKMTREHMGILLYMNIPFIILVTRIDIAPTNIYNNTILSIKKIMKRFNRKVFMVNTLKDFSHINNNINDKNEKDNELLLKIKNYAELLKDNPNVVPVISISNKTGFYVNSFKELLKNLEPREIWKEEKKINGSIFYIDSKFTPPGVGLVVSGILKGDTVKVGCEMYLGPYGKEFIPIRVWSIHNNIKENIQEINNREHGCLATKILNKKIEFKKDMIRKGMLIVSKDIIDNICYQFQCKIKILNHSTTISKNYSPVIHCGTITQTAKIILDDNQELKMGDIANVAFRFIQHPEFIEPNMVFFFREGSTRGVGTVESILPLKDDPNPFPAMEQRRNKGIKKRRRRRKNKNEQL